jgi:colanic acid/amylovoran biosynthesis glycosyltransferase
MENSNKIKLLIFVNNYSKVMETFVYNHVKMLAADSRFVITVLCQSQTDKNFNITENIEIIETGISSFANRLKCCLAIVCKNPVLFFKLLRYGKNTMNLSVFALAEKLKKTNFDIVHAHFGQNGRLISELMDVGLINTKLVTQFYGLDITSIKCSQPGYYKTLIKNINIILTHTQYSVNIIARLGFPKDEIIAIPVGTDGSLFVRKEPVIEMGVLKLIFIGRLIELKGPQFIPEIAKKMIALGFSDFEFLILGEGDLKNDIIEKSNAYPEYH